MVASPPLTPNQVYRTRELRAFTANPTRWAKRLVAQGVLQQAAHGLYYLPRMSRWGPSSPDTLELLRAFLGDDDFLITGSLIWNALDLGITGMLAVELVYTPHRTGEFPLNGRRYWMRRVSFPRPAPLEWFVVDAFRNYKMVGADPNLMEKLLKRHLQTGRFDAGILGQMAVRYGDAASRERIFRALAAVPKAA